MSTILGHTMFSLFEQDTAENRLKKTVFIVEADDFAQQALWGQHASDSVYPPWDLRKNAPAFESLKWDQVSPGWLVTVGNITVRKKRMPVSISVSWMRIEGYLVMFWHPTSSVVDHRLIDRWLEKHFKGKWRGHRAACDANNFHHCLQAIDELKTQRLMTEAQ